MTEIENAKTEPPETLQSIWTKRLFLTSALLLGIIFTLQGVGILQQPEPESEREPIVGKPISAGGLRCDSPIWDFGSVDSVKTLRLSNEFVLTNESDGTVTIEKVHSTCGCMVAENYDKEIAPGKSTKLRVDVTLPTMPQTFSKSLVVQVKGKAPGIIPLNVVGEILANSSLYCVPKNINFGRIRQGEVKERIVRVLRYDLSPVQFVGIQPSQSLLDYSVEHKDTNVLHLALLVVRASRPNASNQFGRQEEEICVKTLGLNSGAELRIPVYFEFPTQDFDDNNL